MPKIYSFKAGDAVPQWIERTGLCIWIFGVDVQAFQRGDYIVVYPVKALEDGYNIMEGTEGHGSIIGAPTWIYNSPSPWDRTQADNTVGTT